MFTSEFKAEVLRVLKHNFQIEIIMNGLESQDFKKHLRVRSIIESELFRLERYFIPPKEISDESERAVYNSAVQSYNEINKIYTQLIDVITTSQDREVQVLISKTKVN